MAFLISLAIGILRNIHEAHRDTCPYLRIVIILKGNMHLKKDWKRIVIKLGTNVLSDEAGEIDEGVISHIVGQIAQLKSQHVEVVLVSSGAVGAGRTMTSLPERLNPVTKRQVYSSIGQIELMGKYKTAFAQHNILCAQVLATKEDFRDRTHYINMRRCLLALLRDNVIPIINENDVISISELMFTDNDELAGWVASLLNVDAMILLSNVAGVLADGGRGPVIPVIGARDKKALDNVTAGKSSFGRGGMLTKIRICQKAAKNGIHAYIANGKTESIIQKIVEDTATCTYFPKEKERSSIKKWMAHADTSVDGKVVVNAGAVEALNDIQSVASLLPIGIIKSVGEWSKGELIQVIDESDQMLGVGIASYSSNKLQDVIGTQGVKPLIHYDYLLIYD